MMYKKKPQKNGAENHKRLNKTTCNNSTDFAFISDGYGVRFEFHFHKNGVMGVNAIWHPKFPGPLLNRLVKTPQYQQALLRATIAEMGGLK